MSSELNFSPPDQNKQDCPKRAYDQLADADLRGLPSNCGMVYAPDRLCPLYQVWEEEKAWENREQAQGQAGCEVEGCVEIGAHPGSESYPTVGYGSPLALFKAEIGVDDARGSLKPDKKPEPPSGWIVMTDAHPIRGRRGKRQDSRCDDFHIDLPAFLAFADEPQMPCKDREAGNREIQNVCEAFSDQSEYCDENNATIYGDPKIRGWQIVFRAAPRPCLDHNGDWLAHEKCRQRRKDEIDGRLRKVFTREQTDQQRTENEYP